MNFGGESLTQRGHWSEMVTAVKYLLTLFPFMYWWYLMFIRVFAERYVPFYFITIVYVAMFMRTYFRFGSQPQDPGFMTWDWDGRLG